MEGITEVHNATTIQQLTKTVNKTIDGKLEQKDVFPISLVQAIFDGVGGKRLDHILALNNCIYVPFAGTIEDTRLSIKLEQRRKGLVISFKDFTNKVYTQTYINDVTINDDNWKDDSNWSNCFINENDISAIQETINKEVQDAAKVYVDEYIKNVLSNYKVDSELNENSTNPVQNSILTNIINNFMQMFNNINTAFYSFNITYCFTCIYSSISSNKNRFYIKYENKPSYITATMDDNQDTYFIDVIDSTLYNRMKNLYNYKYGVPLNSIVTGTNVVCDIINYNGNMFIINAGNITNSDNDSLDVLIRIKAS